MTDSKASTSGAGNALEIEISEFLGPEQQTDGRSKSPVNKPKRQKSKTDQPDFEIGLELLCKFIKPYDGSRETLNSFLINCNNAFEMASDRQRPILFKYILCQLSGKAGLACSIKEFNSWEQLKDFLKSQFSDQKHYAHLLTELQEAKQRANENVSQFSLRVETYLSQLLTEVSQSNTKVKDLSGRVAAMEDLALHHFIMGLYPRISNIVRCRSPKNLNEAINMANSEERIQQTLYKRNLPEDNKPRRFQQQKPQSAPSTSFTQRPVQQLNPITCRYCKAIGHDISNCRKREYNNRMRNQSQSSGSNSFPRVHFVEELETVTNLPEITYNNSDTSNEIPSEQHLND